MIDPKTIEELKAKHADLHLLRHGEDEIIVRRPPKEAFRRFRQKIDKDRTAMSEASERLLYDCTVYPDAPGLTAMLEKRYGLVDTFASSLVDLAGAAKEAREVVPL